MPTTGGRAGRALRKPDGLDGYITRKQAAGILGFASEFKVRQLERDGTLHAVRGPMRTAYYDRADVLAVKAKLDLTAHGSPTQRDWSDCELLTLLSHPTRAGRMRTVLDLVMETRIPVDRAEQLHAFWTKWAGTSTMSADITSAVPTVDVTAGHPTPQQRAERLGRLEDAMSEGRKAPREGRHRAERASDERPGPLTSGVASSERPAEERRSEERQGRDALLRELRDPDPRIRDRAFRRLKESARVAAATVR